jgi:hypothetical protein
LTDEIVVQLSFNHMVNIPPIAWTACCARSRTRTRRQMLRSLALARERTRVSLAELHRIPLAAASKHISRSSAQGLVWRHRAGPHAFLPAGSEALAGVRLAEFHERFWNERLDALEALLRHPGKE